MSETRAPEWLDARLFERALRAHLDDADVVVTDATTRPALAAGDNYTSDMYRTTVGYTSPARGVGRRRDASLIVKLVPDDGFKKRLATDMRLFDKEMSMYERMLPRIGRVLGDPRAVSARCVFAQVEPHTVIMLEDLSASGFGMANRQAGFDMPHCRLVLESLAKMHAASVVVHDQDPKSMEQFNYGLFNDLHGKDIVDNFINCGFKTLTKTVAKWPGYEKYATKLRNMLDRVTVKGVQCTKMIDGEFNVLCHGDLWINNMLFQYGDDGAPKRMKFIDFQMSVYTSPAIDLHYFIFTSPSEDVRINRLDELLSYYHACLERTFVELNYACPNVPTLDQLRAEFERRGFYGVVASTVIMPLIRAPPSDDANIEDMMTDKDTDFTHHMYNSPSYVETMKHLLPYFDERSLLD